jgi:hypothetical protein
MIESISGMPSSDLTINGTSKYIFLTVKASEIQLLTNMSDRAKTERSFPPPPLVLFYDPQVNAPDPRGRTLNSILSWPNGELEDCHNYIQYLFPLPERSPYNPFASVIDRATCIAFRTRADLRARLKQSFDRMLAFYGFQYNQSPTKVCVSRTPAFDDVSRRWVRRFDHNHLRITRILRSMRVLGLALEAEALWRALDEVCDENRAISKKSWTFWTRAAKRPLYLAPEDEKDEGQGADFLYELENENNSRLAWDRLDDDDDDDAVE